MIPVAFTEARYGLVQNGVWYAESKWCSLWLIPIDLSFPFEHWINSATGLPVRRIYCNKDIQPGLERALRNIVKRGLQGQLLTFDGCYVVRDIRGIPGHLSAHSYACAIDINAATNRLNTPGDMSDELGACFTDAGFTWGKTFHRQDPMHMSWLGF